jgi:hypothetical protein
MSTTFLTSPCLPFWNSFKSAFALQPQAIGNFTHGPLSASQLGDASSLSYQSLLVLETASYNTGGDCEVLVVAIEELLAQVLESLSLR